VAGEVIAEQGPSRRPRPLLRQTGRTGPQALVVNEPGPATNGSTRRRERPRMRSPTPLRALQSRGRRCGFSRGLKPRSFRCRGHCGCRVTADAAVTADARSLRMPRSLRRRGSAVLPFSCCFCHSRHIRASGRGFGGVSLSPAPDPARPPSRRLNPPDAAAPPPVRVPRARRLLSAGAASGWRAPSPGPPWGAAGSHCEPCLEPLIKTVRDPPEGDVRLIERSYDVAAYCTATRSARAATPTSPIRWPSRRSWPSSA